MLILTQSSVMTQNREQSREPLSVKVIAKLEERGSGDIFCWIHLDPLTCW